MNVGIGKTVQMPIPVMTGPSVLCPPTRRAFPKQDAVVKSADFDTNHVG